MPSTQLGGTVTRRTTQPMKRKTQSEGSSGAISSSNYNSYNSNNQITDNNGRIHNNNMNNSNHNMNGSSNGISVGGVAGLRALKGQRGAQR